MPPVMCWPAGHRRTVCWSPVDYRRHAGALSPADRRPVGRRTAALPRLTRGSPTAGRSWACGLPAARQPMTDRRRTAHLSQPIGRRTKRRWSVSRLAVPRRRSVCRVPA